MKEILETFDYDNFKLQLQLQPDQCYQLTNSICTFCNLYVKCLLSAQKFFLVKFLFILVISILASPLLVSFMSLQFQTNHHSCPSICHLLGILISTWNFTLHASPILT